MINIFAAAWVITLIADTEEYYWCVVALSPTQCGIHLPFTECSCHRGCNRMALLFTILLLGSLLLFYERVGLWTPSRLAGETNLFQLIINEGIISIFLGWSVFLLADTFLYLLAKYDL